MENKYKTVSEEIINMMKADLNLREKLIQSGRINDNYNTEMEALHLQNADALKKIIEETGYPTKEKFGEEAGNAAWMIIQHSISKPEFMKYCCAELEKLVKQKKGNPIELAFLQDRIAVLEGKKQLYGTQFDWDENGNLSPNAYDDLNKVNERRKNLGMNTLEEQIEKMRIQAKKENNLPPVDYHKRMLEMKKWKKSVGWEK